MKKGFITIATGDERYYRMARTLLRSYRQTCTDPLPFALIADRENEFTSEFDSVIILEHPSYSWMDKLSLLQVCPFDENIFIDADCLIYQDINFLWESFSAADDFSCFGKVLPMESHEGWFTAEAARCTLSNSSLICTVFVISFEKVMRLIECQLFAKRLLTTMALFSTKGSMIN